MRISKVAFEHMSRRCDRRRGDRHRDRGGRQFTDQIAENGEEGRSEDQGRPGAQRRATKTADNAKGEGGEP